MIGSLGVPELIILAILGILAFLFARFLIYLARGAPKKEPESRGQILVAKNTSEKSNSAPTEPNEFAFYCSKCGEGQTEGSKFCRACGEVVS